MGSNESWFTRFWNKVFPIVEWLEDLGELIVLLDILEDA